MSESRPWPGKMWTEVVQVEGQPWGGQLGLLWNHERGGGAEGGRRSNRGPDPDLSGRGPIPLKGFEVEH